MPLKTLCGIFDEPIKQTKKNFIRENIKSIKQLQDILQQAQRSKENTKTSIELNTHKKSRERLSSLERRKSSSRPDLSVGQKGNEHIQISNKSIEKTLQAIGRVQNLSKLKNYKARRSTVLNPNKPQFSDRSVQTDLDFSGSCDNLEPNIKEINIKPQKQQSNQNDVKDQQCLGGFHSIKNNTKPKSTNAVLESNCPAGHVLLPENERVETLNTLKQNYEKLIYSLNSLSITCDTLRIKKKRMQLEEELRDVDEAIKVFDRPKVYVKG